MNKLKKQVFGVIFLILTLVTTFGFIAYNAAAYNQQYNSIERSLERADKMEFEPVPPFGRDNNDERIGGYRFMDSTVYTVILDSDDQITEVFNFSEDGVSDEEIKEIAVTMISQSFQEEIGNLYFADYSYSYNKCSSIIIVDNSTAKEMLRHTLLMSFAMFMLIECAIFIIAYLLTMRITRPVGESFDRQKQFVADASHELKTPLSVIIASAEALESNPTEHKWLENIKSESDRMNRLIADLLDLAKSEAVEDKSELAAGDLSKLVQKSALTFEGVMFEKGITLEDDVQDGITLSMNEDKIRQLLAILLDNAAQHSTQGGKVWVTLKKEKDIVLTVVNEGEGIPKGEEEKIFERFYRADASRNRNENRYGLGLAIAKNICKLHGATIAAKSENGKTTFKVVFKS